MTAEAMWRRVSRLSTVAATLAAFAYAGCSRSPGPPPRPSVVVVSIDTLRSDRLPMYGYGGVDTPALDALRRDGILFEHAYTHAPLTLPAHASLFTGRLPTEHGVRDNSGYRLDRSAAATTLAARLAAAGYATGAAVSAYVVRGATGLSAGFDHYDDAIDLTGGTSLSEQQRDGMTTLRASLAWLRDAAHAGPFLYWLHLYEPHTPYTPPEPYRSRFASAYDGEVAAADAVVGELVSVLRELGVYDSSLVVVLSDHGEGLGDHGEEEHGILLYREAIQVPLLIKLPQGSRSGETVARPVGLIDVLPSILEVAGLEPAADLPGRSLLDPAAEHGSARGAPIYSETYYPRLHHGWSELRSIVAGEYHYVHGPDPELYHLGADPAERRNLAAAEPRIAAALAERVREMAVDLELPAEEDAETRRRLEALGYLAAARRSAAAPAGTAAHDPKTQLASLAALEEARRLFARGDRARAESELRRLVGEQPAMVDAWETLGDVLESAGRLEDALAARERAIETSGAAAEQALKIAPLLLRLGRGDEAQAHARLAIDAFPETAHTVLARIAIARGDLDEAEREARAAVAARSGTVTPVVTLAEVLAAKGDAEGALALVAEVEEELLARALPDPRLFLVRAEILRARGETAEAERSLDLASREAERLLAAHPGAPVGHTALARVHELRGDAEAALAALERAHAAGALEEAATPQLALEWSRRGRAREAVALVEPLARRGDPAAQHALAVAFTEGGEHAAARQVLTRLLEQAPDEPAALELLGAVELRLGEPLRALPPLERAVGIAAERANSWNLLGVARWQGARDGAGAIAAWQRATALDPQAWEALQNLARVAIEVGRLDLARDALGRFVAQAPAERYAGELATARQTLARLDDAIGP